MDFLDPDKMRHHNLMVLLGHSLVAIAIVILALVLLYQSYGYGINREGEVIQNGLVFTASRPNGAEIWLNSSDSGFSTNKRLVLATGNYALQYNKSGYWPWTRSISVAGSSIGRYDYAFLFPRQLDTSQVRSYATAPVLTTQSPDKRWLLVQLSVDTNTFEEYDLKNPAQAPIQLTLPAGVATTAAKSTWELVEWSNDNRHVLLKHSLPASNEFILLDRDTPASSINLNSTLQVSPTEIRLINKHYDRYYVYTKSTKLLQTSSLDDITLRNYLRNVLAYKSYGDNTVLYVTDDVAETSQTAGLVGVFLTDGTKTYQIRLVKPSNVYLLEMAGYSGNTYVVAGSNAEDKVVVYKNPVDQIRNPNVGVPVQAATLRVSAPSFVSFSSSARFVMAENGSHFSVYDVFEDKTYDYNFTNQLDAPQTHATWMDAYRMMYVSGGKLFVFDYDQTNRRSLMPATPAYIPAFTPDSKRVFAIAPASGGTGVAMTSTWMLIPADR